MHVRGADLAIGVPKTGRARGLNRGSFGKQQEDLTNRQKRCFVTEREAKAMTVEAARIFCRTLFAEWSFLRNGGSSRSKSGKKETSDRDVR
jgi:hypothetical protein